MTTPCIPLVRVARNIHAADKRRFERQKGVQQRAGGAIVAADVGPAARTWAGQDIEAADAIHTPHSDADATCKPSIVGEKLSDRPERRLAEDTDVRSTAFAGARDDLG